MTETEQLEELITLLRREGRRGEEKKMRRRGGKREGREERKSGGKRVEQREKIELPL